MSDEPEELRASARPRPDRLVQDEQFRVSQQARGPPQALAHAHRVRGDLVPGAVGQADPG